MGPKKKDHTIGTIQVLILSALSETQMSTQKLLETVQEDSQKMDKAGLTGPPITQELLDKSLETLLALELIQETPTGWTWYQDPTTVPPVDTSKQDQQNLTE